MDANAALSQPTIAAAGPRWAGETRADGALPGLMERLEATESLDATAGGYLGGHLTTTRAVTRDDRLLDAPPNRS